MHAPKVDYEQTYGTLFSPLWAYTLAAYVPDTWDIEIYDCIVSEKEDISYSPLFAFSGINQDFDSIIRTRDHLKAKYPDSVFIIGVPITWAFEQEGKLHLFNEFDHIFVLDGEETLPAFLSKFEHRSISDDDTAEKIIRAQRFELRNSKSIHMGLMRKNLSNYYGAVVEVSRGCPFLCEFCDIRVLPGNNRANNK